MVENRLVYEVYKFVYFMIGGKNYEQNEMDSRKGKIT